MCKSIPALLILTPLIFACTGGGIPELSIDQDVKVTYVTTSSATDSAVMKDLGLDRVKTITYMSKEGAVRTENAGHVSIKRPDLGKTFMFADQGNGKIVHFPARNIEEDELELHQIDDELGAQKTGETKVAGIACTLWKMADENGVVTHCIADNGLLLSTDTITKSKGYPDITARIEAVSVEFGPLAPALFEAKGS